MSENTLNTEETKKSLNFIEAIVENDLKEGKNDSRVQTRFPPNRMDIYISGTQKLSA